MASKSNISRQLDRVSQKFAKELDVNKVLPRLLRRGVFSVSEEKNVLGQNNPEERTKLMLDIISRKDKSVFADFCKTLEECAPNLLTYLALESIGKFVS